eukprot:gene15742-21863_t
MSSLSEPRGIETSCRNFIDLVPDEVLLKIVAGMGSPTVAVAATLCKKFQELQVSISLVPCFASASSREDRLPDAINDAVGRALQGMMGGIDFAIVFITGYRMEKKNPWASTIEQLRERLPKTVAVIGMSSAGIFGALADGLPFELGPVPAENERGVSVLLGRMPNAVVRVFKDHPPGRTNRTHMM